MDGFFHVGFGDRSRCSPTLGVITGYMLFVEFPDMLANETSAADLYERYNLSAASELYADASYGKLHLSITPSTSFVKMPGNSTSYTDPGNYFHTALKAYESSTGRAFPSVDVVYVVPVVGAVSFGSRRSFQLPGPFFSPSGVSVKSAVALSNERTPENFYRVMARETGHTMCLPDLYDNRQGAPQLATSDGWDIMGDDTGSGGDFFGWNKWTLGWLNDDQVDCILGRASTQAVLAPIESRPGQASSQKRIAVLPRSNTTALVFERRAKMLLDGKICAEGILMYTVDTSIDSGSRPIRVIDTSPGSGGCSNEGSMVGGSELTDAPLPLTGTEESFEVPDWSVRVTIIGNSPQNDTTIRIDDLRKFQAILLHQT